MGVLDDTAPVAALRLAPCTLPVRRGSTAADLSPDGQFPSILGPKIGIAATDIVRAAVAEPITALAVLLDALSSSRRYVASVPPGASPRVSVA